MIRLDIYLTKYHNIQSRNKASELIKSKKVFVNNKLITKPSYLVDDLASIKIDETLFYVSRSAYKLKYFVEEHQICLKDLEALDIGASTGGFTQILLENGVKSVVSLDVGDNQLHSNIKEDLRVCIVENTDVRKFFPEHSYGIVTCDVSFISILKILSDIDRLACDKIIILYKPQFEVGKNIKRDKNGVVLDKHAISLARDEFLKQTQNLKWNLQISSQSKVAGKKGNQEELFYFTK